MPASNMTTMSAIAFTNPLSMGGSSSIHYGGKAKTYMNVGEAIGAKMAKQLQ